MMRQNVSRFLLAVFLALSLLPIYWMLNMSLKTNEEIVGVMTLWPTHITFDNYLTIFTDESWYSGYINSIIYVAMNMTMAVLLALPAAYAFSRYSFIGVHCSAMLTERDGAAAWLGRAPHGVPAGGSAVEALRDTVDLLHTTPLPGLPPLTGGLVGYLTYDAVRAWERVPDANPDELGIPELGFLLATDLAVLDHADCSVLLIANAINYDASD